MDDRTASFLGAVAAEEAAEEAAEFGGVHAVFAGAVGQDPRLPAPHPGRDGLDGSQKSAPAAAAAGGGYEPGDASAATADRRGWSTRGYAGQKAYQGRLARKIGHFFTKNLNNTIFFSASIFPKQDLCLKNVRFYPASESLVFITIAAQNFRTCAYLLNCN